HWMNFAVSFTGLLSQQKAGDVASGVGKHCQLRTARDLAWRQDYFAAELLRLGQRRVQIFHPQINGNSLPTVVAGPHRTMDAFPSAGIDHSILHGVVAVDPPSE